jgi:hypothetical protein
LAKSFDISSLSWEKGPEISSEPPGLPPDAAFAYFRKSEHPMSVLRKNRNVQKMFSKPELAAAVRVISLECWPLVRHGRTWAVT